MRTQKIQYRLGKYQVLGRLQQGSTSEVFKLRPLSKEYLQNNPLQNDKLYELVEIDMEFDRPKDPNQVLPQNYKDKDLILKLYSLNKMLDKSKPNQFSELYKFDIFKQILLLTFLDHPGIVKAKQMLIEYEKTDRNQKGQLVNKKLMKVGVVMQFCQIGCFNSLINYINRTKVLKQRELDILKFYFSQVANTLIYLNQQCKVLHRDLKSENVMITKERYIKVIDYGISKINVEFIEKIYEHPQKEVLFDFFGFKQDITPKELWAAIKAHETNRKNLIGSRHYISPELVQKYNSDMQLIDEAYQKTDIWSFGVFIYKTFHEKYPFDGRNNREIREIISNEEKQAQIDQNLPQEVKQLIKMCLNKNYAQRGSWGQIKQLQFFKQYQVDQIFSIKSPIVQIMQSHRNQKHNNQSKIEFILFDSFVTIKQQSYPNRKRQIIVLKQLNCEWYKILIMKSKQTVSYELVIKNENCLKIKKIGHIKDPTDTINDDKKNELSIIQLNYTDAKVQKLQKQNENCSEKQQINTKPTTKILKISQLNEKDVLKLQMQASQQIIQKFMDAISQVFKVFRTNKLKNNQVANQDKLNQILQRNKKLSQLIDKLEQNNKQCLTIQSKQASKEHVMEAEE